MCRISCPEMGIPDPGQATLGFKPSADAIRRFTLYPSEIFEDWFRCPIPKGQAWRPGDQLDLLGPIGRGFSSPAESRRWFLMASDSQFQPLLPLLSLAEDKGASVVVFGGNHRISELPESVEVLSEAEPALEWADFAAFSLPQAALGQIRRRWGRYQDLPLPCPAQILITDSLPCGFGGCLCCGLSTSRGWALRCQQGPVFNLEELDV